MQGRKVKDEDWAVGRSRILVIFRREAAGKARNLETVPWNVQFVIIPSSTENSVKYFQGLAAIQFKKEEKINNKKSYHQKKTQKKLLSHICKFTTQGSQVLGRLMKTMFKTIQLLCRKESGKHEVESKVYNLKNQTDVQKQLSFV